MNRRDQKTRRKSFQPRFESLERRELLAADLELQTLRFVDADNRPITGPVVGEQVHLRVDWTATDVPLNSTFRLRLTDTTAGVRSLTLNSANYNGGGNGTFTYTTLFEGWFATPGLHTIVVDLDSTSVVTEGNESNNQKLITYTPTAPATLPSKLLQPLAGQQNVDWSVVRYSDLDPRVDDGINPPEIRDYACDDALLPNRFKCGPVTEDQFVGMDLQLANFAELDAGQMVYAVADGTVTRQLEGSVLEGIDAGDNAGLNIQAIGDLNDDGLDEFIITAPGGDSDTVDNVGEVYVVYGRAGGLPRDFELSDLLPENLGNGSLGFVVRGIAADDAIGVPSAIGDFNGDGIDDLAIGAANADTNGTQAGEVYLLFGQSLGFAPVVDVSSLLTVNGGDGSLGVVLQGFSSSDEFGASVTNAGDLNGDGITDLAVGAPAADGLFPAFFSGRVYVFYGQTDPLPAEFQADDLLPNGNNGIAGFFLDGETFFDRAGATVVGLGDVNGDGAPDLGIGAPGAGTNNQGAVYVLYGHTSVEETNNPFPLVTSLGSLREANGGDGSTGFILNGATNNDAVGSVLTSLGDLNGDGLGDYAIGAPSADGEATGSGAAYILYGSSTPAPAEKQLDFLLPSRGGDGSEGFVIRGAVAGDNAGTSVLMAGDLNNDGTQDFAVGAPGLRINGNTLGAVYIVYGDSAGHSATVDLSLLGKSGGVGGFQLTGPSAANGVGSSIGAPGDLNGDSIDDLLLGLPTTGDAGEVYVVHGRSLPFRPVLSLDLVTAVDTIEIDHGGGWTSIYENLEPSSITVQPGDVVPQGASLGLVGDRATRVALLHFELQYRGSPVETYVDPTAYWLKPLSYQGQTERSVLAAGVTNLDPTADLQEEPSAITRLHPTYQGEVWFWYRVSHLNPNDEYQVIWQRPNGTVIRESYHCMLPKLSPIFYPFCEALDAAPVHMGMNVESLIQPWADHVGRWQVSLVVNNQVRAVEFFDVASSPIEPEIRMEFGPDAVGNPILLNGRSTPIDFGESLVNDVEPTQDFVIENHGSTALQLSNLALPDGFHVTTPFPSLVNVDSRVRFTIAMDTSVPGPRFGEISFATNDTDEQVYRFLVSGNVQGNFAVGSPLIDIGERTAAYQWLQTPQLIAGDALVFDSDSQSFNNGELEVEIVANATAADRLGIRNVGASGGEIGVLGNSVTYSGVPMGTYSGGAGLTPLTVQFNDQATIAAVQALLQNLTYSNTAADPGGASKHVAMRLTDDSGKVGNVANQQIALGPSNLNQLPIVTNLFAVQNDVIQPAQVQLVANGVFDPDGFVSEVRFYIEANNLPGLQTGPGGDQLVASDTNGADTWSATFSSSLLAPGVKTAYAVAVDDLLAESSPAEVQFGVFPPNIPPAIVFLGVNPGVVVAPEAAILSANGVSDADGFVTRVDFFRESNGIAGLQLGVAGDQILGNDSNAAGGWTLTVGTIGFAEGVHLLYARAIDNGGAASNVVSGTLQVGLPPPIGSVFYLQDLIPPTGNGIGGFVLTGDAIDDQSGYSVSGAGDVNGDGFDDLLIGAPMADAGSPARVDAGITYVIFGKSSGFDAEIDLGSLDGTLGFKIFGATAGDRAGYVSSAGDVNGDGFGDLLVGAPGFDTLNATDAGSAYLIFGKSQSFGATFDLSAINGVNGFRLDGIGGDDLTGLSLSGAGDFNGDGYADLLIGARSADPGIPARVDAGAAYLVYGKLGGFAPIIDLNTLTLSEGFRVEGVGPVDFLGQSVRWAGDINGDGLGDFILGAQIGLPGTGTARGAAFVIFGDANPQVSPLLVDQLNGINGFRITGVNQDDLLGFSVSGIGDFNGDGFGDLAVGVPNADPGAPPKVNSGSAYLIFGNAGPFASVFDLLTLSGNNGFRVDGLREGDSLGISVGAAGDVNGDGFDDVILGAYHASVGNPPRSEAGETYVLFGSASNSSATFPLSAINGQNGFRLEGVGAQDESGWSVAGAGDINGDGYDDLVIGAPGNGAGTAYVFLGRDFTGTTTQVGTATLDVLNGSLLADILNGKQSLDALTGGGGVDVLVGGEGHDVLGVGDLLFRRVDGGRGVDTLRVDGSGLVVDLTALADSRLTGIERIDLTGTGDNTLILDLRELLNLSDDSNQLFVTRNTGDVVDIGQGWVVTSIQQIGGVTFYEYRQGAARLMVQAVAEGTPWQNPVDALDVDNSGGANPIGSADALRIIELINNNTLGNNPLPNPPTADFAPPPAGTQFFYDVNGDGFATPLDPLIVINFLNNRPQGEGEGEWLQPDEVTWVVEVATTSVAVPDDDFLPWADDVDGSSSDEPVFVSPDSIDALAGDVASLWEDANVMGDEVVGGDAAGVAAASDSTKLNGALDGLLSEFADEVANSWLD
ncbi:MAG: choice-of-anchor D domain-containing protein [Pirellulales bacterium]